MTTSATGTGQNIAQWVRAYFTRPLLLLTLLQGLRLFENIRAAVIERNLQVEAHRGLTDSIPEDLVKKWEGMCIEWENDGFPKSKPNPYEVQGARTSLHLRCD